MPSFNIKIEIVIYYIDIANHYQQYKKPPLYAALVEDQVLRRENLKIIYRDANKPIRMLIFA